MVPPENAGSIIRCVILSQPIAWNFFRFIYYSRCSFCMDILFSPPRLIRLNNNEGRYSRRFIKRTRARVTDLPVEQLASGSFGYLEISVQEFG